MRGSLIWAWLPSFLGPWPGLAVGKASGQAGLSAVGEADLDSCTWWNDTWGAGMTPRGARLRSGGDAEGTTGVPVASSPSGTLGPEGLFPKWERRVSSLPTVLRLAKSDGLLLVVFVGGGCISLTVSMTYFVLSLMAAGGYVFPVVESGGLLTALDTSELPASELPTDILLSLALQGLV